MQNEPMVIEEDTEGERVAAEEEYPAWIGWTILAFGGLVIYGIYLVITKITIPFFRS